MGLDLGAFILALISLFIHLVDKLWNIKRHPANDAPSTYTKEPPVSVEGKAQKDKTAKVIDRLFNKGNKS